MPEQAGYKEALQALVGALRTTGGGDPTPHVQQLRQAYGMHPPAPPPAQVDAATQQLAVLVGMFNAGQINRDEFIDLTSNVNYDFISRHGVQHPMIRDFKSEAGPEPPEYVVGPVEMAQPRRAAGPQVEIGPVQMGQPQEKKRQRNPEYEEARKVALKMASKGK